MRQLLAGLVFAVAAGFTHPAHASQDPEEFVVALAEGAFSTLRDTSLSEPARLEKFRALLGEGVDLPLVGRFVLGRYWRRANPEQRAEYQNLFSEYVIATYAGRLKEYTESEMTVKKTTANGNNEYLVASVIAQPGNPQPIRVDWRLHEAEGELRVVDLIIEGISMALTQRTEFGSLIQSNGGDITVLIARLREVASTIQTAGAPVSLTQ